MLRGYGDKGALLRSGAGPVAGGEGPLWFGEETVGHPQERANFAGDVIPTAIIRWQGSDPKPSLATGIGEPAAP